MGAATLGIDLGGSTITWVLLAEEPPGTAPPGAAPLDARPPPVLARGSTPTPRGRDAIVAALTALARDARAGAVGVGVPGHADRGTGVVRFLPNLPSAGAGGSAAEWAGFPLGETLSEAAGKPVVVLNDARAFCLAEHTHGAATGATDALFLTLGTGVGGGVLTGGRLLVGPDDRLGEIGHLTYDRSGPTCGCGNRGCLEMYASGRAIAAAGGRSTAAEVAAAASAGDPVATGAVEAAGRAVGETVASLAGVLPARVLVVGGGVAGALPLLQPSIEAALARRASFVGPIEVRAAALGPDAGALGAALAASGRAGWIERAGEVLAMIRRTQAGAIEAASQLCAASIAGGGVVHTFGTGHSRIPVEEMFPRYGSYPGFHPIVELSMTFHTQVVGANGQRQAMFIERTEGLAEQILANFTLRPTDTMMVFSVSGRNAVPVEMAAAARKAGLPVIAVTSLAESMSGPARHSSGTRLADHADVVIDLCTPVGDALCEVDGLDVPVGPGTSLAAIAVVNEIKVRVAALLAAGGAAPPVLTSAALVGAEESERRFAQAYAEHGRRAAAVLRGDQA